MSLGFDPSTWAMNPALSSFLKILVAILFTWQSEHLLEPRVAKIPHTSRTCFFLPTDSKWYGPVTPFLPGISTCGGLYRPLQVTAITMV